VAYVDPYDVNPPSPLHFPLPPPSRPPDLQALADKKKGITDEDLWALVGDEVHQAAVVWELIDLQVRGLPLACCVSGLGVA
jgi:hypothetical protein